MNISLIEVLGWLGSFIYIVSYFLLSYKIIEKGKFYYLLNKLAAALIVLISISKNTLQPIIINAIWLYISYLGFYGKSLEIKYLNRYFLHITSLFFVVIALIGSYFKSASFTFEVMAWLSVFSFSVSYFLYSMNMIKEKAFHFYNLLAALSIIPKMVMFENYQVVLLEILWAFFALQAYIKNTKNDDYLTLCS